MVHTFKYVYARQPYYFLYDVESGSLSIVDYVAFLCANKRYGIPLSYEDEAAFAAVAASDKDEILSELSALENKGALNAPKNITTFKKNTSLLKALCLHICHDCNMRCSYCFAHGGTYNTPKNYMNAEVGKRAVDMLIENSGARRNLEIDFFGGEPLLNLSAVKEIVSYAKARAIEKNKEFFFTMTTNCLMLDEETARYLNEEMGNVVLSIDGREGVHNAVRKSAGGKDCYNTVKQNALSFRAARGDKKYYVRGTFTSANLDFSRDILALNDMGFDQISVEPVVLPDTSALAIREEHLDRICAEYERFAGEYLDRRAAGGKRWFNFFHFMLDLDHGPCPNKRLTGCGAGAEYLAVSPQGLIYPCHQFVGKDEYLLGDVFSGISRQDIRERFAQVNVLTKPYCDSCFAKYHCGGGCMANSVNFGGSLDGQYKIGCELIKKRLELSLAAAALEKAK